MRSSDPRPVSPLPFIAAWPVVLRPVARAAAATAVAALAAVAPVLPLAAQLPDSLPATGGPPQQEGSASPPAAPAGPSAIEARLSPDGLRIAFRAAGEERIELKILVVGEPPDSARTLAIGGVEPDDAYAWTPDNRHLVFRGAEDGHLYLVSVDPDGGTPAPRDLTPEVAEPARLAGFDARAGDVLVELPGPWPGAPDLYRIDLDTSERTPVAENDGTVVRWMPDDRGVARVAVRGGTDVGWEVARVRGDTITPTLACGPEDICEPLGLHPDGRIWLRFAPDGSAPSLVLLDRITHEQAVVRADLSRDPHAIFRSDSTFALAAELLERLLPEATLEVQPSATDERVLVAASDSSGSVLHLFDRWTGELIRLLPLLSGPAARLSGEGTGLAPDADRLEPAILVYRESTDGEWGPTTDTRRTIERRAMEEGGRSRPAWRVVDRATVPVYDVPAFDPDALEDLESEPEFELPTEPSGTAEAVDVVLVDAESLRPIRRRLDGPFTIRLDFDEGSVTGETAGSGVETPIDFRLDAPVWSDGSALELLVAALPIADGFTARFRMFDAALEDTVTVRLSAEAAPPIRTEAGEFEVWRITIAAIRGGRLEETWYVRRAAPHYLIRSTAGDADTERSVELIDAGGFR